MRIIIFIYLSALLVNATTFMLDDAIKELKVSHPLAKSINSFEKAFKAQNRALSASDAVVLNAEGAHARPKYDKDGYEYTVGLEKNFLNPTYQNELLKSSNYESDAQILQLKHSFLALQNSVKLLYHINCLDRKSEKQYKKSFKSFKKLYVKKQKAYEYGEVSRKELLQLQIELLRLKSKYKYYKKEEQISRDALQAKLLLNSFKNETSQCNDLYPITKELSENNSQTSLQELSFQKKILSADSSYKQHDTFLNSVALSAAYQSEIDTKRVIVALSIPLNFSGALNTQSRLAALNKKSAYEEEAREFKLQRSAKIELLNKKLVQGFEATQAFSSMLDKYENELIPLIEKGYNLAEFSAIEYLLSKREFMELKKEQIQNYKNYYKTLFELYTTLEIKDQK
ncbi:MAG: hypothetical protein GQ570_00495 [Helicobacteraceae bacterium]|nr:hypothetical protein [Helicobacteraceae bacterium]